jgi:hypothetical protein
LKLPREGHRGPTGGLGARWAAVAVAVVTVAGIGAGSGGAAAPGSACAPPGSTCVSAPVSTLEPAATARLWKQLVRHPRRLRTAAGECRPLRGVFYAATDWLRLATKLAASASPCAQYYVSIPPLTADKTKPRPDQAWRIRALGPNFHALAEIHFTAWSNWVASTGSTWYAAGVEARRRMAEAGYDVTKGDTWAVNEFPSAVRSGLGAARANARELARGLYDGDGTLPTRGTVFVVGVGQSSADVTVYQTNIQNWLTDAAFWTDMAAYVSDWSQEVYGDFRRYAVPGAAIAVRRDYLNDYLQHQLVVARVGPSTIDPARTYLQTAFSPLANAAWQWDTGYGWTMVPFDQMQAFVSAQTYALRSFGATTGQPQDHWGFAWQPRNATGLSTGDFAAQTGALLDRLGAALRDSGQIVDPANPGSGACGPPGQNLFCGGDFPGAQFTEAWKSFRGWTQAVLSFATPPQTIAAGVPSGPISVAQVTTSGATQLTPTPIAVTVSSSSPQGQFSVAPTGPWSSTLVVTIPAGSNVAPPFYYQDTRAGTPQLTAAAAGITAGTQVETVQPGAPVSVQLAPSSATVTAGRSLVFRVTTADSFGNAFPAPATWSLAPARLGTLTPASGPVTTFTAGPKGGAGTLTATVAGGTSPLSASAAVTVTAGQLRVSAISYRPTSRAVFLTAQVVDGRGRPVRRAAISILVRRGGATYYARRAMTAANGRAAFRLHFGPGCYRTTVTKVAAPGYRWKRRTPRNSFCR